jgi:hypothetical protein
MRFINGKRPLGPSLFAAMEVGNMPADSEVKWSNWLPSAKEIANASWDFSELRCHAEISTYQGVLTRDFVRDTYKPACARRSIEWTMVWGYPKGRIYISRPNMKLALNSADAVAQKINELKARADNPTAGECLAEIHAVSKGIATSTSSKIAYFAGLQAREGKCLILDEQVLASILYNRFDELRLLICKILPRRPSTYTCLGEQLADAKRNQQVVYGSYVRTLNRLAAQSGKTAVTLERFLFANGPTKTIAKEINSEWKQIKELAP